MFGVGRFSVGDAVGASVMDGGLVGAVVSFKIGIAGAALVEIGVGPTVGTSTTEKVDGGGVATG